ncbi:MAG: DUF1902 domain-containing protein [Lachnospiraceae bacterium]|nr:DUF1902 domain-containing protein [Lachnospiraceae bacterium]
MIKESIERIWMHFQEKKNWKVKMNTPITYHRVDDDGNIIPPEKKKRVIVSLHYDEEAGVWTAMCEKIGLFLEHKDWELLINRVNMAAPEMATLHGINLAGVVYENAENGGRFTVDPKRWAATIRRRKYRILWYVENRIFSPLDSLCRATDESMTDEEIDEFVAMVRRERREERRQKEEGNKHE